MPKVVIANEKREVEVPEGANLRVALRSQGVQLYKGLHKLANCRGLGLCGTCHVLVKKGMENLAPKGTSKQAWEKQRDQVEKEGPAAAPRSTMERVTLNTGLMLLNPLPLLAAIGHEAEMRLACQMVVYGDCTIETRPPLNLNGETFWKREYPNK